MKAFIISTAAIITLLLFSWIYSIYICNVLEDILAEVNKLPDNTLPNEHQLKYLENAEVIWDNHHILLHLFVDDQHHSAVELALKELKKHTKSKNHSDYLCSIEKFSSAIDDIIVIEGRSFFSIF